MSKSASDMTIEEMIIAAKAKNKSTSELTIDEMVALAKEKKQESKTDKPKEGRPTSYKPEFSEELIELIRIKPTIKQIALYFKVDVQTIYNWEKEYPEFFESLDMLRQKMHSGLLKSMHDVANGYSYEQEELKVVSQGAGFGSAVERHTVTRRVEPNVSALQFLVRNYMPKEFSDVKRVDHTSGGDKIDNSIIKYEQLPDELLESIANASTEDGTNPGAES